jgi:hypothetical protein
VTSGLQELLATVAANLRAEKGRQMLTSREVVQRVQASGNAMSEPTFSRIIRGQQPPSLEQLYYITAAMNMDVNEVLP